MGLLPETGSKPEDYKSTESYFNSNVSDNIIVYIGFSFFILGTVNAFTDVSEVFLIGATISGVFFAVNDFLLAGLHLKSKYRVAIGPLTMMGVFSFFLLPIFLLTFPSLLEFFSFLSETGTFYALGFVIIGFAIKAKKAIIGTKLDMVETIISRLKNELKILEDREKYINLNRELQEENDRLKKKINKVNSNEL